ncbi:hypothetical protein N658DRAFT_129072 [Parathielavia hyrcaniae]|uniref:Uncharacterized protein n=1 Tax=Parathielavia hyrcaniae TaxID=113614 RepID=A0AAN6QA21_9PEZI|nr:hypothetical protein N658DRAFT_129072 [Parathielavia hyrcaniae]
MRLSMTPLSTELLLYPSLQGSICRRYHQQSGSAEGEPEIDCFTAGAGSRPEYTSPRSPPCQIPCSGQVRGHRESNSMSFPISSRGSRTPKVPRQGAIPSRHGSILRLSQHRASPPTPSYRVMVTACQHLLWLSTGMVWDVRVARVLA